MTNQPKWKLIAQLGDINPIDHGGYFIYQDMAGQYVEEAEYLIFSPGSEEEGDWIIYRFPLDRYKTAEDEETHQLYLVPFAYAENWPYPVSVYDEWFHNGLADVARFVGSSVEELRAQFCSEDPLERAHAYWAVGEYCGFNNLDSDPITFKNRKEVEKRYSK